MLDSNQVQPSQGWAGQEALEGPGSRIQGLLEALEALDPAIQDPDLGHPRPRIRASGTRILAIPARVPGRGSGIPGQF